MAGYSYVLEIGIGNRIITLRWISLLSASRPEIRGAAITRTIDSLLIAYL